MKPSVIIPTAQEIASHEITHLPPKPWCESCQRGRANDKPHAKLGEDSFQANTPTICIDFFYHGVTGEESKNDSDVDDIKAVSLIAVDGTSGYPIAVTAPTKGGRDLDFFARAIVRFSALMRHQKVCIMGDQEASI